MKRFWGLNLQCFSVIQGEGGMSHGSPVDTRNLLNLNLYEKHELDKVV